MLWALPFLLFTVVLLPWMALKGRSQQAAGAVTPEQMPSTRAMALQVLLSQGILLLLAWLAARGLEIEVPWSSELTPTTVLAAVGIVSVALVLAWFEGRRELAPSDAMRRRLREIPATDPLWNTVGVVAPCAEEFAYRGVLTLLLSDLVGLPLAALASALLFGLAHFTQGLRGALASSCFALVFQGLVHVSGGLLLAVVAHFLYDFGAAWLGRRLARR